MNNDITTFNNALLNFLRMPAEARKKLLWICEKTGLNMSAVVRMFVIIGLAGSEVSDKETIKKLSDMYPDDEEPK